jgi:hypothetical protein
MPCVDETEEYIYVYMLRALDIKSKIAGSYDSVAQMIDELDPENKNKYTVDMFYICYEEPGYSSGFDDDDMSGNIVMDLLNARYTFGSAGSSYKAERGTTILKLDRIMYKPEYEPPKGVKYDSGIIQNEEILEDAKVEYESDANEVIEKVQKLNQIIKHCKYIISNLDS